MSFVKKLSFIATASAALLAGVRAEAQTLRGSRASVELMYARAQERDLDFMATPGEVYRAVGDGALEMLSFTEDLALDEAAFPFVLPGTRRFADSLAAEYHAGCGERLVVTSGVRPLDEQPRNASPKSVHPTGMAVDFRKPRDACLSWLRKRLLELEHQGIIEATEERRPAHFHIAVLQQRRAPQSSIASSDATPNAETKTASADGDVVSKTSSPTDGNAASKKSAAAPKAAQRASAKKTTSATDAKDSKRAAVYRVRPGDNLSTIAKRYNTTADQLQKLNGLRSSRITAGQRIKLP